MNYYNYDTKSHSDRKLKNALIGLIFIFVGFIITGNKLGFISDFAYNLCISWQMLLIGIGIFQLLAKKNPFSGLILISVGGIFILPEILDFSFNVKHLLLPAVLILIGFFFIFKNRITPRHQDWKNKFDNEFAINSDYVQENYIFGGGNIVIESENFKGGKFSAVFGGGKLDLSKAILSSEGLNVLEIDLVFGGLEIIIPRHWNIKIEANSVFGGFSKKPNGITNSEIDLTKTLVIKGSAVFGGADIKRV